MKTTIFFRMGTRYAVLDGEMRVCKLQDDKPKAEHGHEVVEVQCPGRIEFASPWLAAQLGPFTGNDKKVSRARSR